MINEKRGEDSDVIFLTFLRKKHTVRANEFCLKTEVCISVFEMME